MSRVFDRLPGLGISVAQRGPDVHRCFGPLPDDGKARIVVPLTATTAISASARVPSGHPIDARVRSGGADLLPFAVGAIALLALGACAIAGGVRRRRG